VPPAYRTVQIRRTSFGARVEAYALAGGARLYAPLVVTWNFKAAQRALAAAEAGA
jgi:hypothetical protein